MLLAILVRSTKYVLCSRESIVAREMNEQQNMSVFQTDKPTNDVGIGVLIIGQSNHQHQNLRMSKVKVLYTALRRHCRIEWEFSKKGMIESGI